MAYTVDCVVLVRLPGSYQVSRFRVGFEGRKRNDEINMAGLVGARIKTPSCSKQLLGSAALEATGAVVTPTGF